MFAAGLNLERDLLTGHEVTVEQVLSTVRLVNPALRAAMSLRLLGSLIGTAKAPFGGGPRRRSMEKGRS